MVKFVALLLVCLLSVIVGLVGEHQLFSILLYIGLFFGVIFGIIFVLYLLLGRGQACELRLHPDEISAVYKTRLGDAGRWSLPTETIESVTVGEGTNRTPPELYITTDKNPQALKVSLPAQSLCWIRDRIHHVIGSSQ